MILFCFCYNILSLMNKEISHHITCMEIYVFKFNVNWPRKYIVKPIVYPYRV